MLLGLSIAAVGVLVTLVTWSLVARATARWSLHGPAHALRDRLVAAHDRLGSGWPASLQVVAWLVLAGVALLALTVVVGWTLMAVSPSDGPAFDRAVATFYADRRSAAMTAVMQFVSDVGDTITLGVVGTVGAVLWRLRRGSWAAAVVLAGAFVGALAIYNVAKPLVDRDRPGADFALNDVAGAAFPSGHTTGSAAFYTALALLLVTMTTDRRRRGAILAVATFVIGLIAMSRLYLGAHWLTDVLWGWALGSAWAVVSVTPLWSGGASGADPERPTDAEGRPIGSDRQRDVANEPRRPG